MSFMQCSSRKFNIYAPHMFISDGFHTISNHRNGIEYGFNRTTTLWLQPHNNMYTPHMFISDGFHTISNHRNGIEYGFNRTTTTTTPLTCLYLMAIPHNLNHRNGISMASTTFNLMYTPHMFISDGFHTISNHRNGIEYGFNRTTTCIPLTCLYLMASPQSPIIVMVSSMASTAQQHVHPSHVYI
ncbi:hypothetical protein J6590_041370 [Homalodisca vitripennis]|nr:hypothetical protein J6590_041370 [Homalodisca vitripennis]